MITIRTNRGNVIELFNFIRQLNDPQIVANTRTDDEEITITLQDVGNLLDFDKIAKALGAERRGQVKADGGFLSALQTAKEVRTLRKKSHPKKKK